MKAKSFVYLDAEAQRKLPYAVATAVPWNHDGRKSVGYLFAVHHGANFIYDVADGSVLSSGSLPLDAMLEAAAGKGAVRECLDGWYNPYPHFLGEEKRIWPRGFPLEHTSMDLSRCLAAATDEGRGGHRVGVIQSLLDRNPDVDTICRLTSTLPVYFTTGVDERRMLVLREGTMAPFNAQATVFLKDAFWGLLLPISVHPRVADIWRAYVAQRLMWGAGQRLAFAAPFVTRCDGAGASPAGVAAELDLYTKSSALGAFLMAWKPEHTQLQLQAMHEELFIELYERGFVEEADVRLAVAWLRDLTAIGYSFPRTAAEFYSPSRGMGTGGGGAGGGGAAAVPPPPDGTCAAQVQVLSRPTERPMLIACDVWEGLTSGAKNLAEFWSFVIYSNATTVAPYLSTGLIGNPFYTRARQQVVNMEMYSPRSPLLDRTADDECYGHYPALLSSREDYRMRLESDEIFFVYLIWYSDMSASSLDATCAAALGSLHSIDPEEISLRRPVKKENVLCVGSEAGLPTFPSESVVSSESGAGSGRGVCRCIRTMR